jgi:hypothetical protein
MVETLKVRASAFAKSSVSSELVAIAIFSGLGLLVSLSVLLLDRSIPGDWF